MSGYVIEQFPDKHVVLLTYLPDWEFGRDSDLVHNALWQIFEAADSPVFYIVDVTIEPRVSLDDLMMVIHRLLRGGKPLLRHPNMREHLVVTHSPVLLRALKSLPWGFARAFSTLDDALAYARRTLADEPATHF
jgi:hypothetical protein